MIYILGDLHIRKEEPFFTASSRVLEEMKKYLSPNDVLIQLGDLFHTSKPFPKEYKLAFEFLDWCRKNDISVYLLAGNHDYNFNQRTYSIDPLEEYVTEIIYEPNIYNVDEEGTRIFFLPWEPKANFKTLVEEEYPKKFEKNIKESSFLLYHFADETIMFGSDYQGTDLSAYENINPKIKRIGGDIHKPSDNYLGTPYQTRYDEKGQIGRIAKIEGSNIEYIEIPVFINYVDIAYGMRVNKYKDHQTILTIKNAPSVEAARKKYGDYFIRLIETQTSMERVEAEEKELSSLKEAMSEFLTINKVGKQTKEYLQEVVNL